MSCVSTFGGRAGSVGVDELLALLGRHWRLLLLYPGGLSVLTGVALVGFLLRPQDTTPNFSRPAALDLVTAALWLLLIALLPLPKTGWPYALDLATYLILIELPYWLHLLRRGGARCELQAATALNSYPLLALAMAALGQAAGSFVVREVNRSTGLLHWGGVFAWAITLPPLLALGPWQTNDQWGLVTTLRRLAHIALLVAIALPAHDETNYLAVALGFMAAVLPLAALNHWWRGDSQRWVAWQPWLLAGFALLVAYLSAQQFLGRLR